MKVKVTSIANFTKTTDIALTCKHLKDQVETLIRQGKLQKFVQKTEPYRRQQKDEKDREQETRGKKTPVGEIRMISRGLVIGGSSKSLKKTYASEVNNIHSWFPSPKTPRSSELNIVFSKRDAHRVKQPYDDPLVIMLRIEEFIIHRVLVNNGSSVDIIYLLAFQQMKLSQERLRPFTSPLVSFTGDRIVPKGIIKLIVVAGTYLVFLCSPPTYEDSWYFSHINHQFGWAFWVQIICFLSSISEISKWNVAEFFILQIFPFGWIRYLSYVENNKVKELHQDIDP